MQVHRHGEVVANVIRNVWSNAVIFCGRFPDGAEKFTKRAGTDGCWPRRSRFPRRSVDHPVTIEYPPSRAYNEDAFACKSEPFVQA